LIKYTVANPEPNKIEIVVKKGVEYVIISKTSSKLIGNTNFIEIFWEVTLYDFQNVII